MEEQLFKQKIQPAKWVMPGQARMAVHIYDESLTSYKAQKSGKKLPPKDIVPYELRLRGIEKFVTSPEFEKFWKKNGEYCILNVIGGLYMRYLGTEETGFYFAHPKITLAERDKELKRCARKLKDMLDVVNSDISVSNCFEIALHEALKAGNFAPTNPYNVGAFLVRLYQDLNDEIQNGCRRMKTHAAYPRSIREKNKAERGRFIFGISTHVKQTHKRYNHALVSRILNVLRPDLGKFTPEDVRQYMTKKDKSVLLNK